MTCALFVTAGFFSCHAQGQLRPGTLVTPDAHNCYPYEGQWSDRIDRALAGGTPGAIEQDLFWYRPDPSRPGRSVVAHGLPVRGSEPGMEQYFFERVRPLVEAALRNPDHSPWSIITLNLDIKTEQFNRPGWRAGPRDWLSSGRCGECHAAHANGKHPAIC